MFIRSILECAFDHRHRRIPFFYSARWVSAFTLAVLILASAAEAQILRVATYNVDADTGGSSGQQGGPTAGPGLDVVLEAIGSHNLAGHAQPLDVLALEELYQTPSTTLSYIVGKLNTYYQNNCGGCAVYDYDTTLDDTTGGTGGGPSGLIFNTKTVQKLGVFQVGTASGSGAARAPMRYTLAPKGYNDHSADFTIYVSHMKSGSAGTGSGSNGDRRNIEAGAIRDDANSLGINAHIIYSGDYNMDGATEPGYQTMISSSVHSGIGKAIDTLNPANNWNTTSNTFQSLLTESATFVQYRDDVQYVTGPMLTQSGMQLVPNTLNAFGNGGDIYHQSVISSGSALTDLANRSTVLNALTTATDHLPVVADYSFATAVGAPGDYDHSGVVNAADYTLWRNTFGSTTNLVADGNHNGVVDAADYVVWRRYRTGGGGAGSLASGSEVPEPATGLLMLGGCLAFLRRGRLRG
jgi:hypothetical protein